MSALAKLVENLNQGIREKYVPSSQPVLELYASDGRTLVVDTELYAAFHKALSGTPGYSSGIFDTEKQRVRLAAEHGEAKANEMISQKPGLTSFTSEFDFMDQMKANPEFMEALGSAFPNPKDQETVLALGLWNTLPDWCRTPQDFRKTFGHLPADERHVVSHGYTYQAVRMAG